MLVRDRTHQARNFRPGGSSGSSDSGGGGPLLRTRNTLDQDHHKWATHAGSATHDERYYYATDSRGRPVALVSAEGKLVEQYRYSGNGMPFTIPLGDVNADGKVESKDASDPDREILDYLVGKAYEVRSDLNLNGIYDTDDLQISEAANTIAGGRGTDSIRKVSASFVSFRPNTPRMTMAMVMARQTPHWYVPEADCTYGLGPAATCSGGWPEPVQAWGVEDDRFPGEPRPGFQIVLRGCPTLSPAVQALINELKSACGIRSFCGPLVINCGNCDLEGQSPPLPPIMKMPPGTSRTTEGLMFCNGFSGCPQEGYVCLNAREGHETILIHEIVHAIQCCQGRMNDMSCDRVIQLEYEAYERAGQCNSNKTCCQRACGSAAQECGGFASCLSRCRSLYP